MLVSFLVCTSLFLHLVVVFFVFFFFKQKTAYEMRISDWSSDVCSSDLLPLFCNPCLHGEWPLKRHKLDPARRRYVQVPPDFCVVPGLCGGIHRLHRGFRDFQIDSACRHTLVSRHRRERVGHVSPHEAAVFPVPHLCLECRPGEVVADEGNRIGKGGPSVSRQRQPSSIEHVFLRWLRERGFPIDRRSGKDGGYGFSLVYGLNG